MAINPDLGNCRRIGRDKAGVAVGQIQREEIRLLLSTADHNHRLAKICLGVAGGMCQRDALVAGGHRHLIADAIYAGDLDAIAALTVDWRVMAGNSPILQHYPKLWRAKGRLAALQQGTRTLPPAGGTGVVLAASCADRTLEQLAAFERERPVLRIDPANAGTGLPGALGQGVGPGPARTAQR